MTYTCSIIQPVKIERSTPEPPPGSVLIKEGLAGTAYQRHHSDGKWHSTTAHEVVWHYFINRIDPKMEPDYIIFIASDND